MRVGRKKRIGTYLKQNDKSHPANIDNRAFGDNWPGFPLNLAGCGSKFLAVNNIRPTSREKRGDVRRFPLQNLLPGLPVQEIMNVHHSLSVFFGGFPIPSG